MIQEFNPELQALKQEIAQLVKDSPEADLMPRARAKVNDHGLSAEIRDADLRSFILEARGARIGIAIPRRIGETIDTTPTPWVWEGLLMAGSLNLLVAPPKIGKSALMIGMVSAWARGATSYLGAPLHGDCPNVYIVGTDQPESDWFTLLSREKLVGNGSTLADPIQMLWSTGAPLHLTAEGINHLRQLSEADPGALFLIDSYHACIAPLGIEEASSELDKPARALMEALAPSKATIALIHHANKSVSGGNATNASRGSNALPAAASLTVLMNWLKQPAEGQAQTDLRVILKSQGRAKGCSLVVELLDDGWMLHGEGDDAMRAEAFAEAEAELSGRQADFFDYIADRWSLGEFPVSGIELSQRFNLDGNKTNRTVRALERKGLVVERGQTDPGPDGGRPSLLWTPALLPHEEVSTETGVLRVKTDKTLAHVYEKRGYYPFTPLSPSSGGGGVCTPTVGSPVEICRDGIWSNGYVVHDASNPHSITVAKTGNRMFLIRNLRPNLDVRPCSSPYPSADTTANSHDPSQETAQPPSASGYGDLAVNPADGTLEAPADSLRRAEPQVPMSDDKTLDALLDHQGDQQQDPCRDGADQSDQVRDGAAAGAGLGLLGLVPARENGAVPFDWDSW